MTTTEPKLAVLDRIVLASGGHGLCDLTATPVNTACGMEVVAWLANEPWSAYPECASPVLGSFVRTLNDYSDDAQRQKLLPFLPRIVGTRDGQDETRRYLALDWLIRTHTTAWLDLAGLTAEAGQLRALRRIVDMSAASAAKPVVHAAWAAARAAARAAGAAADAAARAAADADADAAWDAARAALKPTVETLQGSALDLLDAMINPARNVTS